MPTTPHDVAVVGWAKAAKDLTADGTLIADGEPGDGGGGDDLKPSSSSAFATSNGPARGSLHAAIHRKKRAHRARLLALPAGYGQRGHFFMYGSILHLYGHYATLRALCIRTWQVSYTPLPAAALLAASVSQGIGSLRTDNGSVPVSSVFADSATCQIETLVMQGHTETVLLGCSLALGMLTQMAYTLRLWDWPRPFSPAMLSAVAISGCILE
ncbi:hypothetical protein HK405_000448, partial [Cladochytrium tenue]